MYRTVFWTLWEKARVGWFERITLKHVYFHMWKESPVQIRCMRQGARGWFTGMTQREGMGREVGGGFRMGNTCIPVVDSCWCMAKPIQYCKVISLQLNKFIFKKKKLTYHQFPLPSCLTAPQCIFLWEERIYVSIKSSWTWYFMYKTEIVILIQDDHLLWMTKRIIRLSEFSFSRKETTTYIPRTMGD